MRRKRTEVKGCVRSAEWNEKELRAKAESQGLKRFSAIAFSLGFLQIIFTQSYPYFIHSLGSQHFRGSHEA
jgi:hypothetical protein